MYEIIVFTSITYAIKAQKLLTAEQIYSSLIKSTTLKESHGCSYGLKVEREHSSRAMEIINRNGIKILSVTTQK